MIKTYQFDAGTLLVPVTGDKPAGCPDHIEVVLGTCVATWTVEDTPELSETQPNWPAFREAIQHSDALLRIANCNPARFVLVNAVMWKVAESPELIPELVSNWNALAIQAQPTSAEIAELNGISADNNIPFQLDEQGLMG